MTSTGGKDERVARDRVEEIVSRRLRAPKRNPVTQWEVQKIGLNWDDGSGSWREAPDFIPVRLVTMLEVFTRWWIAALVDAGEPYVERAGKLLGGSVKFDFGVVQALAGQQVSVGELVSHSVSISQLADLDNIFSALIGDKIFSAVAELPDRWASEVEGNSDPIIADMVYVKSNLATLFNVRHIIVHEVPANAPYEAAHIGDFINAAQLFVHAADQYLDTMLNGNFPLQQQPMNAEAWRRAEETNAALNAFLDANGTLKSSPLFMQAQEHWTAFRHAQSEYVGGYDHELPGSIAPLLAAMEFDRLTRARLEEAKRLVDGEEGL